MLIKSNFDILILQLLGNQRGGERGTCPTPDLDLQVTWFFGVFLERPNLVQLGWVKLDLPLKVFH